MEQPQIDYAVHAYWEGWSRVPLFHVFSHSIDYTQPKG